jgi:poly-beta-1,6-N-acetyl-D-glucosamine synthase
MYTLILFFCFFYLLYVFLIYPFLISSCLQECNFSGESGSDDSDFHSILIVVPAYNEEEVIEKKIRNHMGLEYPAEKFKVLVISDGSIDNTDSIVLSLKNEFSERLLFRRINDRKGKTNAINKVSGCFSEYDFVVFSDANVYLDRFALVNINKCFSSSANTGGVSGKLVYFNAEMSTGGIVESTGAYWKYEEWIKRNESRTGNVMGADGSIFAIRSSLYRILPMHVLDDFSTSMGVVFQGYNLKFSDDIIAFEKTVEVDGEEFGRKVRIANRSYNTYLNFRHEIKKLSFFDRFKFHSHKTLRWFAFVPMVFAWLSSVFELIITGSDIIPAGIVIGGVAAFLYPRYPVFSFVPVLGKVLNFVSYFVVANYANGIGVIKSILGQKISIWNAAKSSR